MLKRILFVTLVATIAAGGAFAQSNQATASATANVISGISITNTAQLVFGSIVAGSSGTVILSAASPTVRTGTVATVYGSPTAAAFNVTGDGAKAYSVSLSSTTATLTRAGGGTVAVSSLTPSCASCTLSGSTGTQVTDPLYVGGTLTLAGTEVAGTYTNASAFTVTVAYQ